MEDIKEYKDSVADEIKLGFIGCGNMAFAIVKGLLKSNIFKANEIIISGTREESFNRWKSLGDIKTTLSNYKLVKSARIVFLCVKPACLESVDRSITGIEEYEGPEDFSSSFENTLVSILAGTSIKATRKALPMFKTYIRAMPNTPLQVQAGCTALTSLSATPGSNYEKNHKAIKAIFGMLGVVDVVDESKFHAITALSGSGPAYVYIMIDALSDAGVKQGLPRDVATRFAAQTLLGASKTVLESGLHAMQLKDQVTSSGGTTIHAIHELEKGGIRNTLFNCIEAATKRSKEMSEN